jgi:hypothetical protein
MNTIKGNYSNLDALKSDLNIVGGLDFYENQNKTEQCWVTNPITQVCITIPEDLDDNAEIAVMSSIREFTKKEGSFMALWVYNPSEVKTPSSTR